MVAAAANPAVAPSPAGERIRKVRVDTTKAITTTVAQAWPTTRSVTKYASSRANASLPDTGWPDRST